MIVVVDFGLSQCARVTIVGAYLVVTLVTGYLLRRSSGTASQFLHARHTLPTTVTSLAFLAANCGALEIVGIVAASAKYGALALHFYWIGAIPAMVFVALFGSNLIQPGDGLLMKLLCGFSSLLSVALCILPTSLLRAQTTDIAATPPMGWNSWNHFRNKVDDATIRAQAEAMVSSGMRDAGYTYVNIDDTWEGDRDSSGVIHANSKFPDMKALADFVHSKRLKIGIYSSPGPKTCAKFEGSYGHELQDAQTYAAWGIDYLKYDLCGLRDQMKAAGSPEAAHKIMVDSYIKMRDALRSTGRPIVYSLCQYGDDAVWEWGASVGGNLWRTTDDINDHYVSMETIGFSQAGLSRFATPGHWNDPDMLEVGNGGMNTEEYRTHMSLWAILAAPLLAGNDLTSMTPETVALLTNKDVIAIDQDRAGKQGDRVSAVGPVEIWVRPLADGSKAVGIFNRHPGPMNATVDFKQLGFNRAVKARDLWQQKELENLGQTYTAKIPGHGVLLLRVSQ